MQIDVKPLPKSEVLLIIEAAQDTLDKYEEEAAKRISLNIDIPGFRKGLAPKAFVMSQVGPEAFFQEVLNIALPRLYFSAVKEKNLQVISRSEIKILSKSPLKFEAKVGLLPEISIKSWEKIKIPKKEMKIEEKEVDDVICDMRRYRATYKPLEREVKKGDRVEIDFQGYDESGAPLEKTKSKNHPMFVGEGSLVEGFEDNLVGMKVGGTKKFSIKFPKDYHHESFKAKTVNFSVEMKRADEPVLPELNEDFISQALGKKKTLEEFRVVLHGDIQKQKDTAERQRRENALLEKLLKEAQFDVPPTLVEEEIDYLVADLQKEFESKGMDFEAYLQKLKKDGKDLRIQYASEAEKRIRVRLILNFLFKEMKIEVSDEEMSRAVSVFLQRVPESERQKYQERIAAKGDIYARINNNLMLDKLFARFLE